MFARQNSDSGANANAAASKNEPRVHEQSETQHPASNEAARQALAEAARLPVPTVPRHVAVSSHPQNGPLDSQQKPRPSSPPLAQTSPAPRQTNEHLDNGHGDLFSGSQLGENFMQSGCSTPQNEPQDMDEETTPNARRSSVRTSQRYIKGTDRPLPDGDAAAFRMADDCRLSVVGPELNRRGVPSLMDGFRDDAVIDEKKHLATYVIDHKHPSSEMAGAVQPKLPVRQVKVKNRPIPSQRAMHMAREVISPSPSAENALRHGKHTGKGPRRTFPDHDSDDEMDNVIGYDEPRMAFDMHNVRDSRRPLMRGDSKHGNVAQHRLSQDRKRRRGSADYDDKMLSCMTYSELQSEPFDMEPARTTGPNAHDAATKLPLKLEQYRQQDPKEQHHMFSTMSIDDWECAGDWFVDQFTDIMNRLRNARRGKRRMIQGFENEAAAREEAVRLRSETIDRKLAKMRADGQRVVEDKIL